MPPSWSYSYGAEPSFSIRTGWIAIDWLLQLYLHHIFGPSDLITGEGAEFRGNYDAAPLAHPYYTVINGSHFVPQMSRYASCCCHPQLICPPQMPHELFQLIIILCMPCQTWPGTRRERGAGVGGRGGDLVQLVGTLQMSPGTQPQFCVHTCLPLS